MVTLTCQVFFFFSKIQVQTVQPNVDRKGKGKIDPSEDIGTPCSLQPPSFDLGIGYTQPNDVHFEDIQKQVDSIISDVVTTTKSVQVVVFTKPLFILYLSQINYMLIIVNFNSQAGFEARKDFADPFVVVEGRLFKYDDHVIVFEHFKGDVEEVDRSTFISWFQRDFKPKNKKKFNDEDDKIKPAFVFGSFPIGHKSWFYKLRNTESSLSSTMLGVLQFRSRTLTVFNSVGKTYHDWKVLEGIEPYVKILPTLMNALRISKKDPDYHGPYSKELKVHIDSTLPQQTNRFDINKCRLVIAALLYKYREMYVKHTKQGLMGKEMIIDKHHMC
ncbi:Hypothetical predicted protein [Olea europaea subsp. europaea]|uniref:Uncharacterized protein n=1 Tax=Olea europaea subsp. europaea TaxID=158383 RepID=A0A8S0RPU6_OLEEU|nr:Hypothetical predicted protein [Olea europaea subsp. europaea]